MNSSRRLLNQWLQDWRDAGLTHVAARTERMIAVAAAPETTTTVVVESPPTPAVAEPGTVPLSLPARDLIVPATDRTAALATVAARVCQCEKCPELACSRTQTVFGVGNPHARVLFLGEAPGEQEDRQGEPFVGPAGQLLNRIITACGFRREDLYICNILRCRPPGNRLPNAEEAANCREFLDAQLAIINPEYIVCWGACAAQNLLGTADSVGRLRGRFYTHGHAQVLVTYHPSYLLREPSAKKAAWEDLKLLLKTMGLEPPTAS